MLRQENTIKESERSFVERLANQLGITANAKYIYGEPVEREGVTVIPVAKAAYGFGGGGGKKANEEGSGGGGGVAITPVGYIEIKDGATHFRPTRDWIAALPIIAGLIPSVLLAVWGISKLIRRKQH